MRRKLNGRAALAALALAISCALATAWSSTPAAAATGAAATGSCDGSSGGSSGGGSGSGGDFQIWQALTRHENLCSGGGNAAATDGTGGQPVHIACWWGPEYSPSGLKGYVDAMGSSASFTQSALMQEYDVNGDPGTFTSGYLSTSGPKWESYNIGAAPAGTWYGLILNTGDTTDQIDACIKVDDQNYPEYFHWGVNGDWPGDLATKAPTFSAQDLAEYIESVVELPHADVQSGRSDGAAATIGVPIWYWQDLHTDRTHLGFDVCAFSVCVTFEANAVSFTIDSGASASQSTSRSEGCTAQGDTLGAVYTGQPASTQPSCGVEYSARLTHVTPTVNTTWQVQITWPGGKWSPPADPVIPTTLDPFDVQDVQAYNEPSPSAGPTR